MLLNFSMRNLGPFKDKVNFSMMPGKISKQHPNHVIKTKMFNALKGSCIYGANASGKSWLAHGLFFLKQSMFDFNNPSAILRNQFKLDKTDSTTEFEVDFQIDDVAYRYCVLTNGIDILTESLSLLQKNGGTKEVFTRKGMDVNLGTSLQKSAEWYKNRTFKSTSYFATQVERDGLFDNSSSIAGSEHFIRLIRFFNNLTGLTPQSPVPIDYVFHFNLKEYGDFLIDLLKKADTGIDDIIWIKTSAERTSEVWSSIPQNTSFAQFLYNDSAVFVKMLDGIYFIVLENDIMQAYKIGTSHNGITFDLSLESSGTIRLVEMGLNFYKLKKDKDVCLIIDELDCRLHSFLSKMLIKGHLENEDTTSQLIVTLHDFYLMDQDIWRTDEIWFTEKKVDQSVDAYSLYQFSPRFDKNLQKGYMQGRYGAVPMIGDFNG